MKPFAEGEIVLLLDRAENRRLVRLRLTQAGIDLMTELYPKFNAVESTVVEQLSAESKANLTTDLRSIIRTVEAKGVPVGS